MITELLTLSHSHQGLKKSDSQGKSQLQAYILQIKNAVILTQTLHIVLEGRVTAYITLYYKSLRRMMMMKMKDESECDWGNVQRSRSKNLGNHLTCVK